MRYQIVLLTFNEVVAEFGEPVAEEYTDVAALRGEPRRIYVGLLRWEAEVYVMSEVEESASKAAGEEIEKRVVCEATKKVLDYTRPKLASIHTMEIMP